MPSFTQRVGWRFAWFLKKNTHNTMARVIRWSLIWTVGAITYHVVSHFYELTSLLWIPLFSVTVGLLLAPILGEFLFKSLWATILWGGIPEENEMKGFFQALLEVTAQSITALIVAVFLFFFLTVVQVPPAFSIPLSLIAGAIGYMVLGAVFQDNPPVARGVKIQPYLAVKLRSWFYTVFRTETVDWGLIRFPKLVRPLGFAAIGAAGVGKSLMIQRLLQGYVRLVFSQSDARLLFYDAKGNGPSMFGGMGVDTSVEAKKVRSLNAYDARSWVWDIGRDIDNSRAIDELSLILIPLTNHGDPFWSNTARAVVQGLMKAWTARGVHWTLRDLCLAIRKLPRLRAILESDPETNHVIDLALAKEDEMMRQAKGTWSTVYSYLARYEPVAALWHHTLLEHPERTLSLREWLGIGQDPKTVEGYILTLPNAARGSASDALNQMVVKRVGQMVQYDQDDSFDRFTGVVVDEVRQSGRLDLETLLSYGRSRGVSVVIGFTDFNGMKDAYTENGAYEMLGQCQQKIFFHLPSDKTAEWAAAQFHTHDIVRQGQIVSEPTILPGEFLSTEAFPAPAVTKKLTFVAKGTAFGAYRKQVSLRKMLRSLTPLDKNEPNFVPRPTSEEVLHDWTPEEEAHFCGKEPPPPPQLLLPPGPPLLPIIPPVNEEKKEESRAEKLRKRARRRREKDQGSEELGI